jgi:FkbM family methyltransferase
MMHQAAAFNRIARVPVVGAALRCLARLYPEGSVVRIRTGCLAGCRWKRSHRYVSAYWLGTYEPLVQKCLVRQLHPGDVFYDIGANAGFFSLLAARCVGQRGHVFAFEPLPENIEILCEQFRLNECRNTTVVGLAVSDHSGPAALERGSDRNTAHLVQTAAVAAGGCPVRTVALDEFVQSHARPDFVKIDVEGAEVLVLQGATRLLSDAGRPRLLVEFHSEELAQAGRGILEAHRYRLADLRARVWEGGCRCPSHVLALPSPT